jgi:hypothetical protein
VIARSHNHVSPRTAGVSGLDGIPGVVPGLVPGIQDCKSPGSQGKTWDQAKSLKFILIDSNFLPVPCPETSRHDRCFPSLFEEFFFSEKEAIFPCCQRGKRKKKKRSKEEKEEKKGRKRREKGRKGEKKGRKRREKEGKGGYEDTVDGWRGAIFFFKVVQRSVKNSGVSPSFWQPGTLPRWQPEFVVGGDFIRRQPEFWMTTDSKTRQFFHVVRGGHSKSDRRVARAPTLSTCSSLAHAFRSIGYRNRNHKPLADSAARLMYLRVYDSRDSSRLPAPSPSLFYSITHAHRSIGYRNRNPKPLADSAARLMYLRVYDSRDTSRQPSPSPSPCYPITHAYRSIGYRNRNPQPLDDSVARLMHLRVYDSRDSSRQPTPSPSLCYSLTHAHRSIGYRNRNPQPLADSVASPACTLSVPILLDHTCTQVHWLSQPQPPASG